MQRFENNSSAAISLIGWWRDAGIDTLVDEQPLPWLERGRAAKQVAASPSAAPPQRAAAPLPITLDGLAAWLMSDTDIPEAGPASRRMASSGTAGSPLMIMIDMPEAEDHATGRLLSGQCDALFNNMLAAIGLDRSHVYVAALCPGRPLTGRLPETAIPRLAQIARHHIALSLPKRLWLMGSTVSRAILGMDDVAPRESLHDFNYATVTVPAVASFAPRFLLEHPAQKANAWADMQMLIKGM